MTDAEYREIIRVCGKSMEAISSPEIALTKTDTLRAILALRGTDKAILGGQVVKFDEDGWPKYDLPNIWSAPHWDEVHESWPEHVLASHEQALEYIARYEQWSMKNDSSVASEVCFTFSIIDEKGYRS